MSLLMPIAAAKRRSGGAPPVGDAHRAWRVKWPDAQTGHRSIADIRFYTKRYGVEIPTTGGQAIAHGNDGSRPEANAFDGTKKSGDATVWNDNTAGAAWIGQDFGGSPQEVNVVIMLPWSGFGSRAPNADFTLEWTDDDPLASPTWTVHATFTPATWVSGVRQVFVKPGTELDTGPWAHIGIQYPTSHSGLAALSEMTMADTVGGADFTSTTDAYGSVDGNEVNAFDNSSGSVWTGAAGDVLGQSPAGGKTTIAEFSLSAQVGFPARAPQTEFWLVGSNNDHDFFQIANFTPADWSTNPTQTFRPPVFGRHRFWRLQSLAYTRTTSSSSNNFLAFSEIEFRETVGGPNTISGGTSSASSEVNGSFVAANAVDGSTATAWQSNSTTGHQAWWQHDYGIGNEIEILEVALKNRNTTASSANEYAPKFFVIQYSDDGIGWTDAFHCYIDDWSAGTAIQRVRSYSDDPIANPDNSAHRYWKVYVARTEAAGLFASYSEIELRTTIGGADVTGSGTASANSVFSTEAASKAYDNDNNTKWISAGGLGQWTAYDLGVGNDANIVEVSLRPQSGGDGLDDRGGSLLVFLYSDDGSSWNAKAMFEPETWADGVIQTFMAA